MKIVFDLNLFLKKKKIILATFLPNLNFINKNCKNCYSSFLTPYTEKYIACVLKTKN